jgi:small nuclear ribonucleoprotein (snRNP)-like protein
MMSKLIAHNKRLIIKNMSEVQQVVDKVIDKIVRIVITDDREYIGRLMGVDKTRSVFLQDALEVIDRSEQAELEGRFLYHELFTPYLLDQNPRPSVLKYGGNIVIPGKHVKSIKLDARLQKVYNQAEQEILEKRS